jgi:hypothetical protein
MARRVAVLAAVAALSAGIAAAAYSAHPVPAWLSAREHLTLKRVFLGPTPVRTDRIWYLHKVAVVWTFNHVVICGACSAPGNASLPRGRVIRMSFNLTTHRPDSGAGIRFCEIRGATPPRRECLQR